MLLSYKAGHCVSEREPSYCCTPLQLGCFLLQVYRDLASGTYRLYS